MTRSQKLELTWVGKDERPRLEPRILLEDPALSYHAAKRVTESDRFDNLLIQGDNLLALKALEQEYAGKVKCVFIDPPYNTGSAFEHYDDGVEHSLWLSLMRDRLEILRQLLRPDGSIWISIDDNEAHYLKVLCDEIFGRGCFISDIAWKRRDGAPNDRKIGSTYDHVLVYARTRSGNTKRTMAEDSFNLMERTEKADAQYQLYEEPFGFDERGPFRKVDSTGNAKGGRFVQSLMYPVANPFTGDEVFPRKGRCWVYNREEMLAMVADKRFFWGKDGKAGTPMRKLFKSEAKSGMASPSIWDDVALNQHAAREIEMLFGEKASFETPKPENLMRRIIQISTNENEIVLDSFLGSGTTAAVAHKMRRQWIGIERGDHAVTHCIPRLNKVIDGVDSGGVTAQVKWNGGGGFRFMRLAPSLLERDRWGNWVVSREYNAAMLTEALCKLEGFRYDPSPEVFWQQGRSTDTDYLYATTQTLDSKQLEWLSHDVGEHRTLLVLCRAWMGNAEQWQNLTLKKVPNAVLGRCEFGKDDYSLQVAALPAADVRDADTNDDQDHAVAAAPRAARPAARKAAKKAGTRPALRSQPSLLDSTDADPAAE